MDLIVADTTESHEAAVVPVTHPNTGTAHMVTCPTCGPVTLSLDADRADARAASHAFANATRVRLEAA